MLDRLRRPPTTVVSLFVVALVVRLLFVTATADAEGPFSAFYKGDTPVWLRYAAALQRGEPAAFELGLPLRPPGTAWIVEQVWDGTGNGLLALRLCWIVFGALAAPLTFLAARPLGHGVAAVAGAITALVTGPLLCSASPNSEAPYVVLVLLAAWLLPSLVARPSGIALAVFGALHGIACLVRVEHALVAALWTAGLCIAWAQRAGGVRAGRIVARVGLVAAAAVVPMIPWHGSAFAAVARYNATQPGPEPPRRLPWSDAAAAELAAQPAFARGATQRFVEATVRHRGGSEVADLRLLDEAFGFRPRALPATFFVALYGPLNFALANHGGADGGFSRDALATPPPLLGGADAYPPDWLASLPGPAELQLEYPPHLRLLLDGYGVGAAWIAAHPLEFAELAFAKLSILWAGVAHGFGGYAIPIGASGIRPRVDLTIPGGGLATLWRIAWLVVCAIGIWRGRRRPAVAIWLAWALAVAMTTIAFFGYARQGAMVLPAFAVLAALGTEPLWRGRERVWARLGIAAVAVLVALELVRWTCPPRLAVDGAFAAPVEPWPPLEFEVRQVEAR